MNIMFIVAHPDDEAFGPAGTIAKLSKDHNVKILCLTKGDRPGNEHVQSSRREAFNASCITLGASSIPVDLLSSDCKLTYDETLFQIEKTLREYPTDIVYTHSPSDLHLDHVLVSKCCMIACRPKPESTVKKLYFFEQPNDWTFGQIGSFVPNTFVDITEQMEIKKTACDFYLTERYDWPDARSWESIEVQSKQRGKTVGVNHAEAFQLVFSRD